MFTKRCPNCGAYLPLTKSIALLFQAKINCQGCGIVMRKSIFWMFALSIAVVVSAIASPVGFVNLLGVSGFAVAAIIPIGVISGRQLIRSHNLRFRSAIPKKAGIRHGRNKLPDVYQEINQRMDCGCKE